MRPAISLTLFFLPFVSALTFTNITPAIPTSGGSITFSWTEDAGDAATVTFQLQNPPVLLNAIAIANNVQTASGQLTLTLPILAATTGYTIVAVQIDNVNKVFGTSVAFSVGPTVTSSSSSGTNVLSSTVASSASVTSPAGSTTSVATTGTLSSGSSGASPSSFNGNGSPGSDVSTGAIKSVAAAVLGIFAGAIFV